MHVIYIYKEKKKERKKEKVMDQKSVNLTSNSLKEGVPADLWIGQEAIAK